jgi:glycosyltransferase involved in cell wall biosynthesis
MPTTAAQTAVSQSLQFTMKMPRIPMSERAPEKHATLCVVLKGYPRLSETFIAQEIRELEKIGFNLQIISLRHPYDPATHPIHDEIVADVLYLPEYLHLEPLRSVVALGKCMLKWRFWPTLWQFLHDLARDRSRNRIRRFGQACVMATEASPAARLYYAHFMHTPASVTGYAAALTSTPWAISAHAKDIWTIPPWEKREKLRSIEWLVTCTRANFEHLTELAAESTTAGTDTATGNRVHLVYHGIDLTRFATPPPREYNADGSSSARSVTLLSVGRTVTKKGYRYLLESLSKLPQTLHWKFVHIGGGELTEDLQAQAEALGIADSISWLGGQPQSVVLDALQSADLFVLPSIIGEDGDRDGLPNVLMEAQSQKLACLSTNISGIPELIQHGETGWLVDQRDVQQLTDALNRLITNPAERERLAENGYNNLHANFSHTVCLTRLRALLDGSIS